MLEFLKSFVEFIVSEWETIQTNWETFIIFGLLVAILSGLMVAAIFKHKYKDIPTRETLISENEKLHQENIKLNEELRKHTIEERMLDGIHSHKNPGIIGEVVSDILNDK